MKRNLIRFLALLLALVICSMTLISCNDKEKEGKDDNPSNVDEGNDKADMKSFDIGNFYQKSGSAFAKLKIDGFHEDIYKLYESSAILVECTVIEDYYDQINPGEKVHFPMVFSNNHTLEKKTDDEIIAEIKSGLLEADYLLAYFITVYSEDTTVWNETKGKAEHFSDYTIPIYYSYDYYNYYPINDGALDVEYIDRFCDNYIKLGYKHSPFAYSGTDKYLWHGMSEEEIATNLRKLSSDIDNNIVGR